MNPTTPVFTICIAIITVLISFGAFNDERLTNKLILWPARMRQPKELYRLLTSGFIHADIAHLFFNMFTFYFLGQEVEKLFVLYLGFSPWLFVFLYLSGIVIASLPSYFKKKDNHYYRSLGASGGVATVIFAFIYIMPWQQLLVFFIPVPCIVFGVLYVIASAYLSRNGRGGNINHEAHLWGAIYGFAFMAVLEIANIAPQLDFLTEITHPQF